MEEQNVVLEITDTEVRLIVGYVSCNKAHLVHVATRPINGLISQGEIRDHATLTSILASLREIRDDSLKEKLVINDVTVILPALGLNIFESERTFNVSGEDSEIKQIDIDNLISIINKDPVPNDSEIIDIIPDLYILDGGRTSTIPPIGQRSKQLTMKAKIHTLPSRIVAEYKKVIEDAKLNAPKFCLNSYAICELGKFTEGIPENHILVDMGSEVSSITLVGNHTPFGTISFNGGGGYIVKKLVEQYGIPSNVGLELLTNYGYSTRNLSFEPAIAKYTVNGEEKDFTQKQFNELILEYFQKQFFVNFDAAFSALLNDYQDNVKKMPLVFSGGFSMMIGFESLAKRKFTGNESIHFLSPMTVGARSSQYCAGVGGLLIASSNKGALSEQKQKSKGLTRN